MEFRLCANPGAGETQACFNEHLLQRVDGQGSRVPVDRGTGWYNYSFRLPGGVTCSRCTLQWNYRAGNNWGTCPDGSGGKKQFDYYNIKYVLRTLSHNFSYGMRTTRNLPWMF